MTGGRERRRAATVSPGKFRRLPFPTRRPGRAGEARGSRESAGQAGSGVQGEHSPWLVVHPEIGGKEAEGCRSSGPLRRRVRCPGEGLSGAGGRGTARGRGTADPEFPLRLLHWRAGPARTVPVIEQPLSVLELQGV